MALPLEFTGNHSQLKALYESGYGVAAIMATSGLDYERVITRLKAAGVTLITGGPHDVTKCHHAHDVAQHHENGARCCEPKSGRRRARS